MQPLDVETLLVGGSIDSTPPQFARERFLPSLSRGRHAVLSEFGRGQFLRPQTEASKCLRTSSCGTSVAGGSLFTYQPVDVGLGYPMQARLGLAAVVLPGLGLVALAWLIAKGAAWQSRPGFRLTSIWQSRP